MSSTGGIKYQFNDTSDAEAGEFKQFKAWHESQGEYGYNPNWATKANNAKLGLKSRKVNFLDKVENTQSDLKNLRTPTPTLLIEKKITWYEIA